MNHAIALPSAVYAQTPHASRSDRYRHFSTDEIIAGLAVEGFVPFASQAARTYKADRNGFQKHLIRLRHESLLRPSQLGEYVPEIVLQNAHDGTSQIVMRGGIFRVVCANGLIVGSDCAMASIRHKGQDIMSRIIDGIYTVVESIGSASTAIARMQSTPVDRSRALEFAGQAMRLKYGERFDTAPIDAAQLLQARRPEDESPTLWHVLNVIQENLIRGGITPPDGRVMPSGDRMRTTRPITNIAQSVGINTGLWDIASRFSDEWKPVAVPQSGPVRVNGRFAKRQPVTIDA